MIFVKGLVGGVSAVVITWIIVVAVFVWRTNVARAEEGVTGLGATAGGWNYLLHQPSIVILLTAMFGLGLYSVTR
jgi:hypothetical protein